MSFQITILKVLAGHPEGRASLADLKRAMAILITSGSNWTDRTKRLAARAPDLDIFSQSFVLRDNAGWQITDAGRAFLDFLQTPIQPTSDDRQAPDVAAIPLLPPAASPIMLVGVNRRRPIPGLAGRRRPSKKPPDSVRFGRLRSTDARRTTFFGTSDDGKGPGRCTMT